MQLCQNAKIMGRISIPAGPLSSNDTASFNVGPITRIARNPAQVISQSKNLCHNVYGRLCADVSLETGEVVAALTPPLYRVKWALLSAAVDRTLARQYKPRIATTLCVAAFCPVATLILTMLVLTIATTTANAQTNVFVPCNASGYFGNSVDHAVPFVSALTV